MSPASSLLVVALALAIVALVLAVRKTNTAAVILAIVGLVASVLGLALWIVFASALSVSSTAFFLIALTAAIISLVLPAVDATAPIFVHETGPVTMRDYRPTNTLAITSLVVVFVVALAGLILGYIALSQIKRTREGGRSLALAAVVVGWVGSVVGILVIGGFVAFHFV